MIASFNPCCRGLGSKTWRDRCTHGDHHGVSILVVVDWVQRPAPIVESPSSAVWFQSLLSWIGFKDEAGQPTDYMPQFEFQSLLSWIGFKDTGGGGVQGLVPFVSILVVVDWVQRHADAVQLSGVLLLFQSLLSWIGFKDPIRPSE